MMRQRKLGEGPHDLLGLVGTLIWTGSAADHFFNVLAKTVPLKATLPHCNVVKSSETSKILTHQSMKASKPTHV